MKPTNGETKQAARTTDVDQVFEARDLALGGLLGALAIALPIVFHALGPGVGPIFLPMYLPILALGLLTSWQVALTVACVAPLLSSVLTGMPPLSPPIAPLMICELAALAVVASVGRAHGLRVWPASVLAVLATRVAGGLALLTIGSALGYHKTLFEYSVLSFAIAWPGLILQLVIVPGAVHAIESSSLLRPRWEARA